MQERGCTGSPHRGALIPGPARTHRVAEQVLAADLREWRDLLPRCLAIRTGIR